jgi:3-dehydroquinate synthase
MTWNITTTQTVNFTITKTDNALNFDYVFSHRKILIIDDAVYTLYGNKIQLGTNDCLLIIKSSESAKNMDNVEVVNKFLDDNGLLRRSEPVIVIGGGVLLDLVGFCCSIYRRGIPYIRVPTTLLSIVDASTGLKTGINHFGRRNRLGSYYPPVLTVIDKQFIFSQDIREISNGIAEILKLAIIIDINLFKLIENNIEYLINCKFQTDSADSIIDLAITDMVNQLQPNMWEKNLQRCVDFGHTFSPGVEMKNIDNLLHGEAVILDCLLSSCISFNRHLITSNELDRIFNVVRISGLSTKHFDFYDIELLIDNLSDIIKHRDGNQFLTLPLGIGNHVIVNDITNDEIAKAVIVMKNYNE